MPVLHFAGWKRHYSLYSASRYPVAASEGDLEPHAIRKGTMGFPLSEPVPAALITRIAKFRIKEIAERVGTEND